MEHLITCMESSETFVHGTLLLFKEASMAQNKEFASDNKSPSNLKEVWRYISGNTYILYTWCYVQVGYTYVHILCVCMCIICIYLYLYLYLYEINRHSRYICTTKAWKTHRQWCTFQSKSESMSQLEDHQAES